MGSVQDAQIFTINNTLHYNDSMFGAASNTSAPFSFGSTQNALGSNPTNATPGLFEQLKKPNTLFGSATTGSTTASNGLFGANNTNTNLAAPTSTFGSAAPSGGLFGQKAPTPAFGGSTSTGGLFGQKPASAGFGTAGGGLFGSSNTTAAPQANAQNAQSSGGLFGNSNAQTSNTATGGLFGASNTASTGGLFGQKPAAPATGGLFGASAPTANKGLFGSTPATGSGGLFGGSTATPANNTLGGSNTGLFGQAQAGAANTNSNGLFGQQQQQQQQQPQTQLTAMTRVGDLPAEFKKELQDFDKYINTQHLIATTLNADLQKHDQLIKSIPSDVNYLHTKIFSIKQALKFDADQLKSIKSVNDELTEDIGNIMQLIIQLSTPGTKLSSSFHLNEFFVKRIKKYREVLTIYENVIKEGDEAITGLEQACNGSIGGIANVVEVVKNQYSLFMELCEILAQVHNEVGRLT